MTVYSSPDSSVVQEERARLRAELALRGLHERVQDGVERIERRDLAREAQQHLQLLDLLDPLLEGLGHVLTASRCSSWSRSAWTVA